MPAAGAGIGGHPITPLLTLINETHNNRGKAMTIPLLRAQSNVTDLTSIQPRENTVKLDHTRKDDELYTSIKQAQKLLTSVNTNINSASTAVRFLADLALHRQEKRDRIWESAIDTLATAAFHRDPETRNLAGKALYQLFDGSRTEDKSAIALRCMRTMTDLDRNMQQYKDGVSMRIIQHETVSSDFCMIISQWKFYAPLDTLNSIPGENYMTCCWLADIYLQEEDSSDVSSNDGYSGDIESEEQTEHLHNENSFSVNENSIEITYNTIQKDDDSKDRVSENLLSTKNDNFDNDEFNSDEISQYQALDNDSYRMVRTDNVRFMLDDNKSESWNVNVQDHDSKDPFSGTIVRGNDLNSTKNDDSDSDEFNSDEIVLYQALDNNPYQMVRTDNVRFMLDGNNSESREFNPLVQENRLGNFMLNVNYNELGDLVDEDGFYIASDYEDVVNQSSSESDSE